MFVKSIRFKQVCQLLLSLIVACSRRERLEQARSSLAQERESFHFGLL